MLTKSASKSFFFVTRFGCKTIQLTSVFSGFYPRFELNLEVRIESEVWIDFGSQFRLYLAVFSSSFARSNHQCFIAIFYRSSIRMPIVFSVSGLLHHCMFGHAFSALQFLSVESLLRLSLFFSLLSVVRPTQIFAFSKKKQNKTKVT